MTVNDRSRWLEPSPPLPVDGGEPSFRVPGQTRAPGQTPKARTHSVRVRDRRERFGDEHVFAAECECGWSGEPRTGVTAERVARRDGEIHLDAYRPPHGHRGRG
jgi:hypothetical protein